MSKMAYFSHLKLIGRISGISKAGLKADKMLVNIESALLKKEKKRKIEVWSVPTYRK